MNRTFSLTILLGIISLGVLGCSQEVDALSTDYLYEFGTPGTGDGQLGAPVQASLNSADTVYVIENGNDRVSVFDSDGKFQFKFGTYGTGDGQFIDPSGIVVGPSDKVYVLDKNNRRVQVFDSAGTYLTQFGSIGSSNGQFNLPQGIAVDAFENIYVADTSNQRIQKFDSNGNHLLTFGDGFGNLPGQFKEPSALAISDDGNIYVTDTRNHRVQVFNSDGEFQFIIGGSYGTGDGQFGLLTRGIGIDDDGNVFVGDFHANRYQVFDLDGNFIKTFGSFGTGPGQFNGPFTNPGFDSEGKIYIAESRNNRVQVLGSLEPVDVIPPVVTVSSETVEATSFSGANVSFTVTSIDDVDGSITPSCDATSGDVFTLGSTTITCTATDAAGNEGINSGIITINAAPLQTQKTFAIELLESSVGTDKKTIKGIEKAVKNIIKSQDEKYWETGDTLTKHGKKVFDGEKKAVKELLKIIKKDKETESYNAILSSVIDELVRIDSTLANNALSEAQLLSGEKVEKEIVKAEKELVKAADELAKGKPDKAIDKFKKVWEHAQHAIKHQSDD